MTANASEKNFRPHVGRNIRCSRMYLGLKQDTLATYLGISQKAVSKIEQQEEIQEQLLLNIAELTAIPEEIIKDYDEEGFIQYLINSSRNDFFEQIVKSFELRLKNERKRIEILLTHDFDNKFTNSYIPPLHFGRKIEAIRRLRKITQTELGIALGISKQAVSKMEKAEKIKPAKIKQVAAALNIAVDALRSFNDHSSSNIAERHSHLKTANNFQIEEIIDKFQYVLQREIETFEKMKMDKNSEQA